MKNSDFDIDLRFGQKGEVLVNSLLTAPIETVEAKTDRRWKETGNLYIEVYCWSFNTESWYPSGLSITKASHWSFVLEGTVLTVPTLVLKDACVKFGRQINCEIPPNQTRGYLVTVDNLMESTKTYLEQSSSDDPCSSQ
jgi:hypothetical protein